jgi:hypothetical protein
MENIIIPDEIPDIATPDIIESVKESDLCQEAIDIIAYIRDLQELTPEMLSNINKLDHNNKIFIIQTYNDSIVYIMKYIEKYLL